LCHLQHKLIGFYNRDEKCLQRGTDWVFKYSGLRFVLIIIIIIFLSWIWATCWPVPVSRIQKSLQKSTMIPSASWEVVFHYTG